MQQVLIASLEPHATSTSASPHTLADHVLSCDRKSSSHSYNILDCASQLPRPRRAKHRAAALPADSPTALIIVQALDTTEQQEKAHRNRSECCGRTSGLREEDGGLAEEAEGTVDCDLGQQYTLCTTNQPLEGRWYAIIIVEKPCVYVLMYLRRQAVSFLWPPPPHLHLEILP